MAAAGHGRAVHDRPRVSPIQAWLRGGLTVGVLDALDAFLFYGMRGIAPGRILQSVASGLLGLVFHFCIALGIVATFFVVARAVPFLTARPYLTGPVFGLMAYAVMTFVVVPLSAAAEAARRRATC